ncbi:uracil-DNA glycosylase family protein [Hydrogenophaga sp. XSHU_21]
MSADDTWVRALDARQRAMLGEMGVKVWAPRHAVQPAVPPASVGVGVGVGMDVDVAVAPAVAPAAAPAKPVKPMAPAVDATATVSPVATSRPDVAALDWAALREAVSQCRACGLCETRRNTVFGVGDVQAHWMIVGEAPGENEDRQGEPFVGAAGQLLDAMLRACGRSRTAEGPQGVFIANVLKCRPPANRNPAPEEVAQCEPFLARQVALVKPRLILAMGRFAVQALLKTTEPIGRLRGQVHHYEGVPVIVTYHPAYLLRNPIDKAKAWADLCLAMDQ